MKKLILLFSITGFFACGTEQQKTEISKTDSISAAIDSAQANDTLLLKLKQDTVKEP